MNKRKLVLCFVLLFISSLCFSKDKDINVVASTSWTASFAELAGCDNVDIIAPVNLRHPPEYEVTVGDVLKIRECDYFIYAGFERMMKTLSDTFSTSKAVTIQIQCDNSLETVKSSARKIAKIIGTEEECEKRLALYEKTLIEGKEEVNKKGKRGAKVLCHKHQIFLAKELGLEVVDTFGPGPVSAKEIANAKNKQYDYIIDNIHNPVGEPLKEVNDEALYIIWRNFPETRGKNSLIKLIKDNIEVIIN